MIVRERKSFLPALVLGFGMIFYSPNINWTSLIPVFRRFLRIFKK